jgi:hypothetical protein
VPCIQLGEVEPYRSGMNLILALADGSEVQVAVPMGMSAADALHAFTHRRAPYNDDWIEVDSTQFVRYSAVVDVRVEDATKTS